MKGRLPLAGVLLRLPASRTGWRTWWGQLDQLEPEFFSRFLPPDEGGRQSAVLILFGPGEDGGEDVVLTERSHSMRSHAGQVSFPGGAIDPTDFRAGCGRTTRSTRRGGPGPGRRSDRG